MEAEEQRVTHVPSTEGKTLWIGRDLLTFKAVGEDTNGAYMLGEAIYSPEGKGPPPHIHTREDEAFYVLEGEFEFLDNDRTLIVGAGSFIHIPKGTLHTHKNVGTKPGRMLILTVPAGLEKFFEEMGTPATDKSSPRHPPVHQTSKEPSRFFASTI